MLDTPVAFLIWNRPALTATVFEAIAGARPRKLLVVADGPRTAEEAMLCQQARAIVDRVDWECEVVTNFADENMGCKQRVSSGLDWVFSLVEEAIVLEDDCLPHPDFFPFCQELLRQYRDDERIMMISGDNFLPGQMNIEESYVLSRYFAVWGWASWRRAWKKYDLSMTGWETVKAQKQLNALYSQGYARAHLSAMFDAAQQNEIDTWDIQWFYSCLFQHGLSVVPKGNLVSNIGVVGAHSSAAGHNHNLPVFPMDTRALRHPGHVFPDERYDSAFFHRNFRPPRRGVAATAAMQVSRALPDSWRQRLKTVKNKLRRGASSTA